MHDVVERFWDIIEDININRLLKFLKDNIIFTVVLVTLLIWLPGSVLVSYVDRKSHKLVSSIILKELLLKLIFILKIRHWKKMNGLKISQI